MLQVLQCLFDMLTTELQGQMQIASLALADTQLRMFEGLEHMIIEFRCKINNCT